MIPVLPDPVPRDGERALARWGLLGEGAVPVFNAGARYPLAGLLLALPALEDTGLLAAARQVYGRLRGGFYGLTATLLALVFLALAGEPRAEGATRVPPAALGRVLGLDRAPEVKTIRRKLGELAAAGKAADLIMALARHHAAARPDTLGFLYLDGHARVYSGTRDVQKTHVARLKFPAPATMETWVTGQDGDPVFMVVAEPSDSLAGELRRLLPDLRAIVGQERRVTVCFDRGGWSPALFAHILAAGFDLLTWRKGPAPDLPAGQFTAITCADDRGREHRYDLADTTLTLTISDGPRKGQAVSLRQVTRKVPARHGGTRQIHALTSRQDLAAGEVCWRLTSRWREENYFRYLDRGELVPDQVVLDMVREAIVAAKAAGGGFVLDGIPRNMHQARAVYLIGRELEMTADVALHLQADDGELMLRLLARAALEHRSDDTPDIIAQRLELYHDVTSPIISWYRDRGILVSVDAMRSAQQVGREILAALEAMRPFLDQVPGQARRSVDLTGLGDAFGATGPAAGASG